MRASRLSGTFHASATLNSKNFSASQISRSHYFRVTRGRDQPASSTAANLPRRHGGWGCSSSRPALPRGARVLRDAELRSAEWRMGNQKIADRRAPRCCGNKQKELECCPPTLKLWRASSLACRSEGTGCDPIPALSSSKARIARA
jgi:hypothetical protein